MGFVIDRDAFCEHCQELEPFDLTWWDAYTSWCMSCVGCLDPEDREEYNSADQAEWEEQSRQKKIGYYEDKLRALKEQKNE